MSTLPGLMHANTRPDRRSIRSSARSLSDSAFRDGIETAAESLNLQAHFVFSGFSVPSAAPSRLVETPILRSAASDDPSVWSPPGRPAAATWCPVRPLFSTGVGATLMSQHQRSHTVQKEKRARASTNHCSLVIIILFPSGDGSDGLFRRRCQS